MVACMIKIPRFHHLGLSCSLVYLIRGDSRHNLIKGSLSAAMSCAIQRDLVDLRWCSSKKTTLSPSQLTENFMSYQVHAIIHNWRSIIIGDTGYNRRHNIIVSFGDKPLSSKDSDRNCIICGIYWRKHASRWHIPHPYWQEIVWE